MTTTLHNSTRLQAPVTASGSEPGHPFRGNQWTEISGLDAKKLLKPSEKPGSHDPAKFIKDTDRFKVGKVALSDISKSESGAAYDSTVNMDRAKDYASRQGSFPPILIGEKRVSGLHNVHDGGHRTTAARLRGDTHIAALIKIRSSESSLLSAVRAERLARRVEAVRAASGAYAAGHKFWGNQWSEHAKDLLNDPVGEPSGKIKHAVMIINGKRYRGLTHIHAVMQWAEEPSDSMTRDIQHEGFETESGHFLNRNQGAKYTGVGGVSLDSQEIKLAARNGQLYTQDAIQAAEDTKTVVKVILQDDKGRVLILKDSGSQWDDLPGGHVQQGEDPVQGLIREVYEETGIRLESSEVKLYREQAIPKPHGGRMLLYKAKADPQRVKLSEEHSGAAWVKRGQLGQRNLGRYAKDVEEASQEASGAAHSEARAKAQAEHKRAALMALGLAAHAVADGQTAHPDGKAKVVGGMLAFMALGAAAAYVASHATLGESEGVAEGRGYYSTENEADGHAQSRTELLKPAAEDAVAELEAEKAAVEREQVARGAVVENEISKRLAKKARELEGARWERIADTEATATYGASALRVLDLAGFATVKWSQLDRPTKRHTHAKNQEQGEQPLGFVFSNGQAYPGDPARGPDENINCLCQLIGVRRKELSK